MSLKYFSKNGEILPIEEALIPVKNLEYSYGFGVYESIKIRKDKTFHLEVHIERLFNSATIVGVEHKLRQEEIIRYCKELIEKLEAQSFNIKILLIGARNPEDCLLFIIPSMPLFPRRDYYKNGVHTVSRVFERLFPQAKTLNMLGSYLAYSHARKKDCYDALLIDREGFVLEGTRCNFFAMRGKDIISPPYEKVLDGITRRNLLKLAADNGYGYLEENISFKELGSYDSFFLTSTSSKLLPISKIDDMDISISEELKALVKLVLKDENF